MPSSSGQVSFELRNQLSELEKLVEHLELFADERRVPVDTVFAVNLALEELITNTISYGYSDGAEHRIGVTLEVTPDETMIVTITDDGRPFDPLDRPDPDTNAPLEERAVGGLGVLLVRRLMDEVTYRRVDGNNVLVLKKHLTLPDESGDSPHGAQG